MTGWDYVSEPRLPTGLLFILQVVCESGEPWWWCRLEITPDSSTRALWQSYQEWNGRRSENFAYQYLKYLKGSLTCRKILRHVSVYKISVFTSHPKKGVLRIFIALKNPLPRPGLNPWPLGPVASTLTTTPPRRLVIYNVIRLQEITFTFVNIDECELNYGVFNMYTSAHLQFIKTLNTVELFYRKPSVLSECKYDVCVLFTSVNDIQKSLKRSCYQLSMVLVYRGVSRGQRERGWHFCRWWTESWRQLWLWALPGKIRFNVILPSRPKFLQLLTVRN
jgi:hypothetical protein